jgi:hypothetical protein
VTEVKEGISVAPGDNYPYTFAYPWLDISSRNHVLHNTVKPDHTLLENNYDDNSSVISISLTRSGV